MFKLSRPARSSRYTPIVGCAFLIEALYGSKYSANLGAYNMPYVYVKTILLCATGHGLEVREGRYLHGLIELLLPSKVSQDNLTKLELLQFVDALPMNRMLEGLAGESEEEVQTTMALMLGSGTEDLPPPLPLRHHQQYNPSYDNNSRSSRPGSEVGQAEEAEGERPCAAGPPSPPESTAAALRRHQREAADDAAAIESILSFVSPATFPSSMARVLIYDAVCTCVADGLYSVKEKERVALVSSHIGLSTAVRGQIEKLALQEKVLSIRKRRLLRLQPPPQPPLLSHAPQAEETEGKLSRQTSNVPSHSNSPGTEGGREDRELSSREHRWGTREPQMMVRDTAAAEAVAAGGSAEDVEEVKKIEAAKRLLRRARRRQQRHNFLVADG
ncbi:hypothetical protein ABB37_02094 [Leptomonas pyrrhocoris]|uniref:Uncharacterized protein n=1 Tax=Leptomonas pyrrhocoris TaxID=157538 RepID=A0A0M9G7H2_LEPPY|nr:hypothetical protein ABB37_02094 [Leptomonas pyrrhocoris]XP_015662376.1 hypothetical protein ABB37_02094 [Leptomonas pyrrhocoris]KPA83936.1 hypothetical protein ABB37_02094 [Leptomonas pyrrhocoris]KPA83937.1 hypothetical protein ABB37_02094 [Leptomonas pyrrhocoris]|eukprot:XP_015662375.1 hypothetical protein ABB37_02094 [Leptomonas pyrrhocoris]